MGNCTPKKWVNDKAKINIKESWDYEGKIIQKLKNNIYPMILFEIK